MGSSRGPKRAPAPQPQESMLKNDKPVDKNPYGRIPAAWSTPHPSRANRNNSGSFLIGSDLYNPG